MDFSQLIRDEIARLIPSAIAAGLDLPFLRCASCGERLGHVVLSTVQSRRAPKLVLLRCPDWVRMPSLVPIIDWGCPLCRQRKRLSWTASEVVAAHKAEHHERHTCVECGSLFTCTRLRHISRHHFVCFGCLAASLVAEWPAGMKPQKGAVL